MTSSSGGTRPRPWGSPPSPRGSPRSSGGGGWGSARGQPPPPDTRPPASQTASPSARATPTAPPTGMLGEKEYIVSLYQSEIMTAIRGAAPAACSVTAAPSPSRAASRAWASGRPRAARARWPRWPPCPRCPAPAPAQDTKGREVRDSAVSRSQWYDLCPNLLTSVWIPLLHYRTVWTFPLTRSPGAWSELGISLWLVRMNIWPLRHFYDLIAG